MPARIRPLDLEAWLLAELGSPPSLSRMNFQNFSGEQVEGVSFDEIR